MRQVKYSELNSVCLPVGIRRRVSVRPSLVARVARAVDKLITRTQEWMERPDGAAEKILAFITITMVLTYFVAQLLQ